MKDTPPLDGVVVIENAKGVAASYAGRMLALMGATVIKVELPGTGDPLRQAAPALHADLQADALFAYLNVNKSSVTLDLTQSEGQKLLKELLARATIFIDDTYPDIRHHQTLTPESICALFPKLIYVSVLPFGALGEHSQYRGYEINAFHSGGEGYLMPNGLALEMFPERPPVKIYGHFAEFNGGVSAVCATFAALMVHDEVGGQWVDISVQDANVAVGCFNLQQLGEGTLEHRHERSFKYGGVLECSDGFAENLTLEQHQWEGLVTLMGEPAWAMDVALNDPLERSRQGKKINDHLRAWAKTQKVQDLVEKGQALKIPFAKYAEPADIFASEQTQARHMFSDIDFPGLGKVAMLTAPLQFSLPSTLNSCPNTPGADNQRILGQWLQHKETDLQRWLTQGVV